LCVEQGIARHNPLSVAEIGSIKTRMPLRKILNGLPGPERVLRTDFSRHQIQQIEIYMNSFLGALLSGFSNSVASEE
jgi:hypothetical protein